MPGPEDIMKSIWNDLSRSLACSSDWQVELVGQDGSVKTDALPLVLFSPVLREVLVEQKNVPYMAKIILPDFRVESLRHIAAFIKHGFVNAEERHLLQLTDIITVLKLSVEIGQFTVTDIMKDQVISTFNEGMLRHSTGGETSLMLGEELHLPFRKSDDPNNTTLQFGRNSTTPLGKGKGKKSKNIKSPHVFEDPVGEMCLVCSKMFESKGALAIHFKTHERREIKMKPLEREILICKVCGLESHSIMGKLNHMCDIKSNMPRFTCGSCQRVYAEKCIMLCHQQQHYVQRKLNCPICGMRLQNLWLLMHHIRRHTNESDRDFGKFVNEDSNSSMTDDSLSHGELEQTSSNVQTTEISREELLCNVCNQSFATGIEKVEHDCNIKPNQLTFKCKHCDKLFIDECFMFVHQQQHSSDMKNTCAVCAETFSDILDFVTHMRQHLTDTEDSTIVKTKIFPDQNGFFNSSSGNEDPLVTQLYNCLLCDSTFSTKARLMLHEQTHKGKSESECPYCGSEYATISNALIHVKIHLNLMPDEKVVKRKPSNSRKMSKDSDSSKDSVSDRQTIVNLKQPSCSSQQVVPNSVIVHKCSTCKKVFDWEGTLLLHQQIHKGKSDLECPQCGKQFQLKNHANLHMRSHLGYMCKLCREMFPSRGSMMSHRKESHDGEVEKKQQGVKRKSEIVDDFLEDDNALTATLKLAKGLMSSEENLSLVKQDEKDDLDFGSSSFTVTEEIVTPSDVMAAQNILSTQNVLSVVENIAMEDESNDLTSGDRKYQCSDPNCKKVFKWEANLIMHERVHQGLPELECPFCETKCETKSGMATHIKSHTGFICPECKAPFQTYYEYTKHRRESCMRITCNICKKEFLGKVAYEQHKRDEHISKPGRTKRFYCDVCHEQFVENEQLLEHQTHCSPPFPEVGPPSKKEKYYYRCSNCAEMLDSRASLFYHEQAHENTGTLECPKCRIQNVTKQGAIMHVSRHWLYTCEQCMIKFLHIEHVNEHKLVCAAETTIIKHEDINIMETENTEEKP